MGIVKNSLTAIGVLSAADGSALTSSDHGLNYFQINNKKILDWIVH